MLPSGDKVDEAPGLEDVPVPGDAPVPDGEPVPVNDNGDVELPEPETGQLELEEPDAGILIKGSVGDTVVEGGVILIPPLHALPLLLF